MPRVVIGVSIDTHGNLANYVWRCKLVSNTSAARKRHRTSVRVTSASANMPFYAKGFTTVQKALRTIARRTHHMTAILAAGLTKAGYELTNNSFFDTITINSEEKMMHCTPAQQTSTFASLKVRSVSA